MVPASSLNVSSVILRCYPENSPWDLDPPPFALVPVEKGLCTPFPQEFKDAALLQAQRTGLNPFYFMCWSNPLLLDDPSLAASAPPLDSVRRQLGSIGPLPSLSSALITRTLHTLVELPKQDGNSISFRFLADGEKRVLKLFLDSRATNPGGQFQRESSAYARFAHFGVGKSGAVARCYGTVLVDIDSLRNTITAGTGFSQYVRDAIRSSPESAVLHGIVLEDLGTMETLSITNITDELADRALRALYEVHSAYVLHGAIDYCHVVVDFDRNRVIWTDFGHSVSPEQDKGGSTRADFLEELANCWYMVYARLIPDATIGYLVDGKTWSPWTAHRRSPPPPLAPVCRRVPEASLHQETLTRLLSYPETNVFSWDPPIYNLTPAPKDDYKLDTVEFLKAARDAKYTNIGVANPLVKWYGSCPLSVLDTLLYSECQEPFTRYERPPLIGQLPDSPIQFLEHVSPSSNRALFKVLIDGQLRLVKIFSAAVRPSYKDLKTPKERFDIELSAYSHLMHSGVCDTGAAPRCFGWMEFSPQNARDANKLVRETQRNMSPSDPDEVPVLAFPVFDDASPAVALVLEYLPNSTPLIIENVTPRRADMALRALSRVHGAYILHGDVWKSRNILVVRDDEGDGERVVIVDYDHAMDPTMGLVTRLILLTELARTWILTYNYMLSDRRLFCNPVFPHDGPVIV
ncbi:hypothetical protein C8Q79DRAFT_1073399 [Trametes meyenii]|nr:hypothetical protein C8Q79DRAFT_1073399 [Trametes meyenii]